MYLDDQLIFLARLSAAVEFAALLLVVGYRLYRQTDRRLTMPRLAMLSLWWSLSFVSVYAAMQEISPDWFAAFNTPTRWGPLALAVFALIAGTLSCIVYLPRSR